MLIANTILKQRKAIHYEEDLLNLEEGIEGLERTDMFRKKNLKAMP